VEILYEYMQDGAYPSAKAVLAYLQQPDGIEESWDDEKRRYMAEPKVARWENCREQGYIVSMRSSTHNHQINIAFFEHRNSDTICAVMWEQVALNTLTIDTAEFGDVYKDKYDVSHGVDYEEASAMASWIEKQLIEFWERTYISRKEEN
jgi:hypothetical protein